ncbi:MAG: PepSY domain-containing protein [Sphingomonadales bacterium]|nr:PepSY domain-containing protein [Sphingomonadales bacterium]
MRKWHRWLSVIFGMVLLWIAVTGVLSQVVPLAMGGEGPPPAGAPGVAPAAAQARPTFVCPPDYMCRPKPKVGDSRLIVGFIRHLHSGEALGPVGRAIFILAGFAMVFFAFSGLWVYIQMWRARSQRSLGPGWFWK